MTSKKIDIKDLKVNIGSKQEKAWTEVKNKVEQDLITGEISAVINKLILEEAEKRIKQEKEKFKY